MVKSINSKIDLVVDATSYMGLTDYGKIMIGDHGFEFFHNRDLRKFIQIPWEEVDLVIASVLFKGKWIPRFAIKTKRNGTFTFAAKTPKKVLGTMKQYIDPDHIVHSLSFFQVVWQGIRSILKRNK
ncbi:DUF956 family protein [Atopobacter phocae]|uniref:DUF956 family protein n=1 Tax=Atopobacter phocae TaxID=136492 RepID=UPI00046E8B23|nr:DUF956 family protein [Atopobacter phocae]